MTTAGMGTRVALAVGAIGVTVSTLVACGGGDGTSGDGAKATPSVSTGPVEPAQYGSVTELRDAAVEAGYMCENWVGDNAVTLAAESGTCDDESVLTTYASDSDLEAQLANEKATTELLTENGIATTPLLVGPNWLFKAPEAPRLRKSLGGVLIGARED